MYQAMRVTGAADPTVSVKDTLKGKLPQKKLVRGAAHGYSSYGNQIGLAKMCIRDREKQTGFCAGSGSGSWILGKEI